MKLLLSFLILIITSGSFAQIVNIENKRLNNNKQGFNGNAELNFNFTMNTVQLLQIGDKIQVGYVKKQHQYLVITDHTFIKSEGEDFVNRGFEHLRYNYTLKDSGMISLEAFQQGQFNKIQKINLRLLLGGGIRFSIIDEQNYLLSFGTGFMGEYEELTDFGVSLDILSTSYLSFDGQFSETTGFNTIFYYQSKLIDYGNYRFSNETSLRFKINKHLSFKLIYTITHDSRDIPEVRKTNYIIRNALLIRF